CSRRVSQNDINTLSICDRDSIVRNARSTCLAICLVPAQGMLGPQHTGTDFAHRDQWRQAYQGRDHIMKKYRIFLGVLAVLSLLLALSTVAQQPAPTEQSKSANQSSQNNPPDTLTALPGVLWSTETLLGSDVKTPQGQNVGDLKQLMIDPHTGRVMYAVVGMGGFLGMGEKSVIVPWHAIEIARTGKSLVLHLSPQMLQQAPIYEKGKESVYAPGSEPSGGWGMDTPYGRLYDPAKEETISGQVVSIDTSAPLPGMAPGMQM